MSIQPYYVNQPPSHDCGICLERLNNNEPVLAHTGGETHPLHEKCWKRIPITLSGETPCPYCRKMFNFNRVLSWKERLQYDFRFSAIPIASLGIYDLINSLLDNAELNDPEARKMMCLALVGVQAVALGLNILRNENDLFQFLREFNGLLLGVTIVCLITLVDKFNI